MFERSSPPSSSRGGYRDYVRTLHILNPVSSFPPSSSVLLSPSPSPFSVSRYLRYRVLEALNPSAWFKAVNVRFLKKILWTSRWRYHCIDRESEGYDSDLASCPSLFPLCDLCATKETDRGIVTAPAPQPRATSMRIKIRSLTRTDPGMGMGAHPKNG